MEFAEANKRVHKVEDQWHYKFLIAAGFEAITKIQIGFVRSYEYRKGKRVIVCATGAACDYWRENSDKHIGGYWADLEPHLKKDA